VKVSKTSKIGIVVVFSLTILIWGINYLKGRDIFRTEKVYIAKYKNVGGLESSTVVLLNGLKIGYVRDIYFAEDFSGDLIVKIAVYNKFPLPVGTTAEIVSTDLLGSRVVQLNIGHSDQFYQNNDTLQTKIEQDLKQQVSEQIAPIKEKAERLLVSLDSIVSSVSMILNSESRDNIGKSIEQISITMSNLEHISKNLSDVLSDQKNNLSETIVNFKDVSGNLSSNSKKLDRVLDNFSSITDSLKAAELKQTIDNLNMTAENMQLILSKINASEGSLGLMINDPRLYQNLNYTSENLNRLLVDLKQNPQRYVKFSAIDLGREVYYNPAPTLKVNEDIIFKVLIFTSESPIGITSPLFQEIKEVEEIKSGNKYQYYTGSENDYEKIRMILNNVQLSFPQASLKAFQKGNEISVKKALKSASK
jgi:phospholipid/cholesterol/gamma-HCH transport system substrate-binding protein